MSKRFNIYFGEVHKFIGHCLIPLDPCIPFLLLFFTAGKVEDDQLRLRDVINIVHATLQRSNTTLLLGDEYWNIRQIDLVSDSIIFLPLGERDVLGCL